MFKTFEEEKKGKFSKSSTCIFFNNKACTDCNFL